MRFIYVIMGLVLGALVYSTLSEKAKEKHIEEACAYYQQQMQLENVPLQQGDTLQAPDSILEYSREYMPLLHPKWEQVRSAYTTTSSSIKTMELRYEKLVELNQLNTPPVDAAKPKSYLAWIKHQNAALEKSKRAHEQILKAMEKYYADAQIRGVDSDAEMQSMVGGLVKTANMVLGDHGYEAALTPETTTTVQESKHEPKQEAKQESKQEPAKKTSTEQIEKHSGSSSRGTSSKSTVAAHNIQQNKFAPKNSRGISSAKAVEIQSFMKLVNAYASKISRAAVLMDSICDASSGRAADKELSSLASELTRLKKQCRSFHFNHVKNFDAEVRTPNRAVFSRIETKSGQIKNRLQLLQSTRGWVSGSTLSNLSNLLKK